MTKVGRPKTGIKTPVHINICMSKELRTRLDNYRVKYFQEGKSATIPNRNDIIADLLEIGLEKVGC